MGALTAADGRTSCHFGGGQPFSLPPTSQAPAPPTHTFTEETRLSEPPGPARRSGEGLAAERGCVRQLGLGRLPTAGLPRRCPIAGPPHAHAHMPPSPTPHATWTHFGCPITGFSPFSVTNKDAMHMFLQKPSLNVLIKNVFKQVKVSDPNLLVLGDFDNNFRITRWLPAAGLGDRLLAAPAKLSAQSPRVRTDFAERRLTKASGGACRPNRDPHASRAPRDSESQ